MCHLLDALKSGEHIIKRFVCMQGILDVPIANLFTMAYYIIFLHGRIPLSLLCFAELILPYATQRAFKILGKILKLGTGSDAMLGITYCLIIFPTANVTYIFFHFHFLQNIESNQSTNEGAV